MLDKQYTADHTHSPSPAHQRFRRGLTAFIAALPLVAFAQPAEPRAELRAAGAFGRTPITQAMMASESEYRLGYLRENAQIARDMAARLEAIRAGKAPPAADSAAQQQAIVNMTEALNRANETYVIKRRSAEEAKSATTDLFAALGVVAATKRPGSALALSLVSTAGQRKLLEGIEAYSGAIPELRASVTNALVLGLIETDPTKLEAWKSKQITDDNVRQAAADLFGNQNAFFDKGMGASLPPEVRIEVINAQAQVLKDAISRVAAQQTAGEAQLAAFKAESEKRFQETKAALESGTREFREFRKQFVVHAEAIEAFAVATKATLESVQTDIKHLSATVKQVDARTRSMEHAMWRKMDEREKLAAIKDGFLGGVTGEARDKLERDLQRTVTVLDARDTANMVIAGAGGLAKVAASLGVPIDVNSFNRTLAQASAAVNVCASLMTGNYVGALMQAGGLFGGGGEDPNAAAFKQINAKLDKIIDLQIETLKKIDELSQQIARNHQEVMETLVRIEAKVDFTNDILANSLVQPDDYRRCVWFVQEAARRGMVNGVFASYDDRKRHFDYDWRVWGHHKQCRIFLSKVVQMSGAAGNIGGIGNTSLSAPLFYWAQAYEPANFGPSSFSAQHKELWLATSIALGVAGKANCERRLVAALASPPDRISQAREVRCGESDIEAKDTKAVVLYTGSPVTSEMMSSALAPGAVRHIGEALLFMSPYFELSVLVGDGELQRLMTVEELAQGDEPTGSLVHQAGFRNHRIWLQHFLDIANLAVAQQTSRSGVYLSHPIAEILRKHNFGSNVEFAKDGKKLADEFGIAPDKDCLPGGSDAAKAAVWAKAEYLVATCLLQKYPELRANVGRRLVFDAVVASGATSALYRFAVKAANDRYIRENVLPMLPTIAPDAHSVTRWSVKLSNHRGDEMKLPVPTAVEVWSSQFSYSPMADTVLDIRTRIEDRLAAISAQEQIMEKNDRDAEWLLRQAAMKHHHLIEVPLTTFPLDLVFDPGAPPALASAFVN